MLALWIGPAMRRVAAAQDLRTVGDYLEFRYSRRVRGIIAVLLWIGSIFILAVAADRARLDSRSRRRRCPRRSAAPIGGVVITVYFAAGGLLTSAWVNVVQLAVKMTGFAVALPLALAVVGGWDAVRAVRADDAAYWTFWRPTRRSKYLTLLAPAFVVSPGLLQKIFGARDDRAVRLGVGLNALGLLLYAGVPAVLGHHRARAGFRSSPTAESGAADGADARAAAARRRDRRWRRCSRPRSARPTPCSSC